MPTYEKVAIIGVGLMGGSIGKALLSKGLSKQVVGIGRRQSTLDKAQNVGAITHSTCDLAEGVDAAELVIVCTPVSQVISDVVQALAKTGENTLVTDVGSTKAEICRMVSQQSEQSQRFVGSHPLAGNHLTGPENSLADLYTDKIVVITPTTETESTFLAATTEFWQALGAKVIEMTPEKHDEALAKTSHLPHLIASAVAASTPDECLSLAASGWADTTRVAAGDPDLWTQIFAQNKTELVGSLEGLIAELQQIRKNLNSEDWEQVTEFLAKAKRKRDALGN